MNSHAHRPVRFRSAARADCAAPGAPARRGAPARGAAGRDARARRSRGARPARPAAARRCARLQRHQGDPGAADRPAHRARRGAAHRGDAGSSASTVRAGAPSCGRRSKLQAGDVVRFGDEGKVCFLGQLDATVEARGEDGEVTLAFAFHGPVLDQAIDERGDMPLPPYIASRRAPDAHDRADYQTMFAREEGSVAAPTAGLHFTRRPCSARLRGSAASACTSSRCMSAPGTFLPVKADDTADHAMHAEWGEVSAETADALNAARRERRPHRRGRLDVAAAAGKRDAARTATIRPFAGETVDVHHARATASAPWTCCMTNFHLPRSTLFMLVAAFCRARRDAARLCPCDRVGLPLLFLRRCLPAIPA